VSMCKFFHCPFFSLCVNKLGTLLGRHKQKTIISQMLTTKSYWKRRQLG
jgi:hypothetical protein